MFKVLTLNDFEEWDNIVKDFSSYDVYYLSGYVKAFNIHGDGNPLLIYYADNYGSAINVVMKRDISEFILLNKFIEKDKYFDLSTPYGYGGWLIENNPNMNNLFSKYEDWCRNNNIISEFIRFHPVLNNQKGLEKFYNIIPLGKTVALDLKSNDVIWDNIISKNKNMIRKAIKNDIKIYNGRSPILFEEFKKIYNLTMNKDNATDYYYFNDNFYNSILNDLPYNSEIFYAVKDNKIIASSIMIFANGYMNYHLSGSLQEYKALAPTNLLLLEAAKWGSANKLNTLHLGGGVGSSEDGLLKFKKSFYKGDLYQYYIGTKIFNINEYNKLVELRKNINNENYFPKYRG